jgi:hypothetical protein
VNIIGLSVPSTENTVGALVQVVPHTPPSSPIRDAATDGTKLVVTYSSYTEDGGSNILAYELEINRDDGNGFVLASSSLLTTIEVTTSITSG